MALTKALHESNVAMAGADYTWPGVRGGSRPGADVRKELRLDLCERQGNLCPVCGDTLRFAQFNHAVSRGPGVLGFLPTVLFAGCALCNLDCALRFGSVTDDGMVLDGGVIPFEHFARPDLIPSEWTPFPVLRERNRAAKRNA